MMGLVFSVMLSLAACTKTIHVYDMAGSGKSSLVLALCPSANVVISHQNEGTLKPVSFSNCTIHGWTIVDMPGYGTPRHHINDITPFDNVSRVLLVVSQRIYQADVDFYGHFKRTTTSFVPVTVVRSRCDIFPCDELQLMFMATKYLPGTAIFGASAVTRHGLDTIIRYVEIYETFV